ncbi:hypothetical protein ACWT_0188 [Actinoplanes sp. SE50]|uniref:hypothetical protein n=1 Tax=unclassified Actinoplanes TaxID=2626549 RepID=UPI00023ED6EB|nr:MULTISPECIES: hypothetical protein [unclassified Actinoplanes]AEV81201.1 hypothetical protein ACPL_304 [Actinoplanes sp. SE50/110]ATO79603.1 hypothetical protein ACWT_0188 [Actinoplanes sp. SE50]SLL97006.1 hypothetical protein ACSP50_0202 [Actinoplanes sp. SE50/110]
MAFIVAAITDRHTRDRIQELLTAEGHIPMLFSRATPAATEIVDGLPDVVVLDAYLPEPEMTHVLTVMHEHAATAGIPVLVYGSLRGLPETQLVETGGTLIQVSTVPTLLASAVQMVLNARRDWNPGAGRRSCPPAGGASVQGGSGSVAPKPKII